MYDLTIMTLIPVFQVDLNSIPGLTPWNPNKNMQTILTVLRENMGLKHNYKLAQPPEGQTYCS